MHSWYDATEWVSVRYHSDGIGGANSEFVTQETKDRIAWYGVTGFPTVVFQGTVRKRGASEADATGEPYREIFLSLKGPSPFKIEVTNFDPVAGRAEFDIEIVSDPGDTSDMVFRSVVIEDNMRDSGGDMHHQVVRDILPPEQVRISAVGETQHVMRIWTTTEWNPTTVKTDDLNVVGFVQNDADLNNPEILQVNSSYPKPNYALTYYVGNRVATVPRGTPTSLEDFVVFNAGTENDTYHVRLIEENVPAGWTAVVSDGTNSDPNELTAPLDTGVSQGFHLRVTPGSHGYAVYNVELYQEGAPNNIKTVRYTVLTDCLPVLVVDDDGGDTFEDYYTAALVDGGYVHGVWPMMDAPLPADLSPYSVVVWNAGWSFPSLDANDRDIVQAYLEGGGKFFISGQDVGWDLNAIGSSNNASAETVAWYNTYLHASYLNDDTDQISVSGMAFDPITDPCWAAPPACPLQFDIAGGTGANNQDYPSEIGPTGAGISIFEYAGSSERSGIRADTGVYKVVYLAFGFEAIAEASQRAEVMQRIMDWLEPGSCGCSAAKVDTLYSAKSGAETAFSWDPDPMAPEGFNLYETDDKTVLPTLRATAPCMPDCQILQGVTPPVTRPLAAATTYYQVLGVCTGGEEGPN